MTPKISNQSHLADVRVVGKTGDLHPSDGDTSKIASSVLFQAMILATPTLISIAANLVALNSQKKGQLFNVAKNIAHFMNINNRSIGSTVAFGGVSGIKAFLALGGKDFRGADLRGADLRGADLRGADLRGADLRGADLFGANLGKANLAEMDMSVLSLFGVDMRGTVLVGANLRGANLKGADLSGADLRGADLRGADLRGADLSGADLSGADLQNVILWRSDLRSANLKGSDLRGADLRETNLSMADLTNANLNGSVLCWSDLHKANLTQTTCNNINLSMADLRDANLSRATILLIFPTYLTLDLYFNHMNNNRSILTTIDSINDEYNNLKINLMHQVIAWFIANSVDITSIIVPLQNILMNNEIYTNDPKIFEFLVNYLLPSIISNGDTKAVLLRETEIKLFVGYIAGLTLDKRYEFMTTHNGFFIQLIYHCQKSSVSTITRDGKDLYVTYLSIPYVRVVLSELERLGDEEYLADQLIFISSDSTQAFVVAKEYLTKFLYPVGTIDGLPVVDRTNWGSFIFFKDSVIQSIANASDFDKIFETFKLFKAEYQFQQNKSKFLRLLTLLNLKTKPVLHSVEEIDYLPQFIKALSLKSATTRLVDLTHNLQLKNIFSLFLNPDDAFDLYKEAAKPINIKDDHFTAIKTIFELDNKTLQEQAQTLLCLAGVFTKYSSSSFFGTEDDSPVALRYYAYALMNRAHLLYNNITELGKFSNWQSKFLGIDDSFTCTAVLSDTMMQYCRDNFPKIANRIIPPSWA